MDEDSKVPVLVKALDRLKTCADGQQKKGCLTSKESEKSLRLYLVADRHVRPRQGEGGLAERWTRR